MLWSGFQKEEFQYLHQKNPDNMKNDKSMNIELKVLDRDQCIAISGGYWKIVFEALKNASFAYEALKSFMKGVAEGWNDCKKNE